MNKPTKKEITNWCNALRSGKYKQTKDILQDENGYCCLGVLCKTQIPKYKLTLKSKNLMYGLAPSSQENARIWMKKINKDFKYLTNHSLSALNDYLDFTFDEIADVLEAVYVHEVLK